MREREKEDARERETRDERTKDVERWFFDRGHRFREGRESKGRRF